MVNCEFIICHPVGKMSLEKESSIQAFSEMYAVDQDLVVKYMHHLAYLEMMKRKRERERREKAEREQNLSYEDVEWEKLLCEDLLKKQRVSVLNLYIGHHNLTSEKKLSKKDKLNVVSAHIQLSAAIQSVSTRKDTSGSEANSSSEASEESSEDYVVQEFGSDSSEDDEDNNIPLAKLASNNCDHSDSDNVPLSALTKHSI